MKIWPLGTTLVMALALGALGCGGGDGDSRTRVLAKLPDHAQVAFTHSGQPSEGTADEIRLLRADGSQTTIVENASQPSWSPDGMRLAFVRSPSGTGYVGAIWVSDADGSSARQLTIGYPNDRSPVWSPSGRMLAFVRDDGIYVISAEGGNPRRVVAATKDSGHCCPAWSPSAQTIAFTTWFTNVYNSDIWTVAVDGSQRRRLTHGGRREDNMSPAWSASANRIAYESLGGISVMDSDGGRRVRLTRHSTACFAGVCDLSPNWSPDGRWIVVDRGTGPGPRTGIFMIGADGHRIRQLTDGDDWAPAWRPQPTSR